VISAARLPSIKLPPQGIERDFDLFICAIGYESRARGAWQHYKLNVKNRFGFGFDQRREISFAENRRFFESEGFNYEELTDLSFRERIRAVFQASQVSGDDKFRVGVDISCFNRSRLAAIVDAARSELLGVKNLEVEFFYTLATYAPPSSMMPANTHVGPVSHSFAGWTSDPALPPCAIVGLGYEQDKALGALEHLQVPHVVALMPLSSISEYDLALKTANSSLLSQLPANRLLRYRVEDPVTTYSTVESLVQGIKREFNPILLPFGPKVFFVCCALAACHHPEASVWRVSAEAAEEALDRNDSGHSVSFCADFESSAAEI
jgi:hypothetical protein